MDDLDLAAQMSQLGDQLRERAPTRSVRAVRGCAATSAMGLGDGTSALEELGRPRGARGSARPGLQRRQPRRRRRGRRAARARPAGGRRPRTAAPASSASSRRRATSRAGTVSSSSPPRPYAGSGAPRSGRVFADLEAGMRGAHDLHDAGAAGDLTGATRQWQFGDEQPFDVVRTVTNAVLRAGPGGPGQPVTAVGRGLRGARDGASYVGRGLPARRPVVLDGAQRHLGSGEADRAGAAHAGDDGLPAGRPAGRRLLQLRARAPARRAGRARLGHGAGHQPAARADGGRAVPRPAPGRRPGRARGDRRRADGAPDPRRQKRSSTGRRRRRRWS